MAIIGKIRENSVLVLIIVGISLVLFILGDFLTNPGNSAGDNSVGSAYGESIDAMEYDSRVNQEIDAEKQNRAMRGMPELNENDMDQIRENVFNSMVADIIRNRELSHFPFSVSSEELNDMVHGVNLHPAIRQEPGFQGPDGQFSRDSLIRYLNYLESPTDQAREMKRRWKQFEQDLKRDRIGIKYSTLITKGVYVTNAEAKRDYEDNNRTYKIRFVSKRYFEIPDSMVTVTDEDIRAYYDKNKFRKQWEQQGSRVFEYVQIPLVPSEEDRAKTREELNNLKELFRESKNDSSFVMSYSENKYFADRFYNGSELSPGVDSLIQKLDSGDVVGPYEEFGYMRIGKIRGVKFETEARIRHILLSKDKGDIATLNKRADSIKNVIKRNKNFEEMVTKFTDDPGSVNNGGVYEWFGKGVMVEPFEKACLNGKTGDLVSVETSYGVHIIEILGKREAKRVKYATVDIKIVPGPETEATARGIAMDFLETIPDGTKFEESAQKANMVVLRDEIPANQRTMNQDEKSRELVRFVQTGMEHDVSEPILLGDFLIVAHISAVKPKGVPEFEDVKEMMAVNARQEKKAEMLKKQMTGAKSLEEIATRVGGTVLEADVTFATPTIRGGGGNEYNVVGTLFSMTAADKGAITVPISGKVGVYVVQLVDIVEPQPAADLSNNKRALGSLRRNRAGGDAFNALKENAKVVDNRQLF
ncbi:MAG TPA: hypothetical protein DCD96_02790 [Flavobacteriales bacterium]|nr:hypothetical protein [Flavobacteriales bacterium]HRE75594.1 peptidylprolyl isomerase [Flavobacteriales bacterium]HRJ34927.1 peptidylprolyl isomerase [Flavobacteriales bacterium]HRJ40080.1 peptidylprolyl isomerase [Flavobacteriales bacterium]